MINLAKILNLNHQVTKLWAYSISVLIALVALSLPAQGQSPTTPARPDRGFSSTGAYAVSDIESVSLTNGNVHLSIPLAGLPPIAGGKLSWTLRANYNSKLWNVAREEVAGGQLAGPSYAIDHLQMSNNAGWANGGGIAAAYTLEYRNVTDDYAYVFPEIGDPDYGIMLNAGQWYRLMFTMPDGSEHEMRPLDYPTFGGFRDYLKGSYNTLPSSPGVNTPIRYYSIDGSYLYGIYYPQNDPGNKIWEVYMPDGSRVVQRTNGHQRIYDINNNYIDIYTLDGPPLTTHYVDVQSSPQREIRYVQTGDNTRQVQYPLWGGTQWANIDIVFDTIWVRGKTYTLTDRCNGTLVPRRQLLPDTSAYVVRSITLPSTEPGQPMGRKFEFTYNSDAVFDQQQTVEYQPPCGNSTSILTTVSKGMGSLCQMKTPSGATVNYTYSLDANHIMLDGIDAAKEVIRTKTIEHDGTTDQWTYSITSAGGSVVNPDGTSTAETMYPHDAGLPGYMAGLNGKAGLVYRTNNSGKQIIERHWTNLQFNGGNAGGPGGLVSFNAVADAEYTTLMDNSNPPQPVKMSAKTFLYDYNGHVTQETDYDWFNPNSVSRDTEGVPTGVPAGATVLRVVNNFYFDNYNAAPTASSNAVWAKAPITGVAVVSAIKETFLGTSQARFLYDGQNYGSPPMAGNLTRTRRWDDFNQKWLDTTYAYDSYGNKLTVTEPSGVNPNGNTTTFVYDSATQAQPVSITVDPQNGTGTQTTQFFYDFATGLVNSQTDPNQKTTTFDYTNQRTALPDPYDRSGIVTGPAVTAIVGGTTYSNQHHKVITKYFDHLAQPNNAQQVEVSVDLNTEADGKLKSRTTTDQLGRPVLSEKSEDGSTYTISARTVYEQMGKRVYTTNPYRSAPATTDGWTRTTKDELGRVVEVATFSGTMPSPPPQTGCSGTCTGTITTTYDSITTTVTDQVGKQRRSVLDGLGRLAQVIEDPAGLNYSTTYGYDAPGNLNSVTQGSQTRTYTYDSLSRLRTAKNPEQVDSNGVKKDTIYDYDDASNLKTKTNPNLSTINFTYDGLNRVKTKALSGGPTYTYTYDGAGNKGRLMSVVKQGGTDGYYYDSYDAVGKLLTCHQITDGATYSMSYGYNVAGSLTTETYPSGRVITTDYDPAGRLATLKASNKVIADTFNYTASGAESGRRYGNNLREYTVFNSRLQPTTIGVGTASLPSVRLKIDYTYGLSATTNNGNVQTETTKLNDDGTTSSPSFSHTYSYDSLNRLTEAYEGAQAAPAWKQKFIYDRYGNRNFDPATTANVMGENPTINPATNRFAVGQSYGYDVSGNLTSAPGSKQYTYDAENKQTHYNDGTNVGDYTYDGEGRRVMRVANGTTTVFVYDAMHQLVAEYTSAAVELGGGTSYLTDDAVGSMRLVTHSNGDVKSRHDYLPFGEEISSTMIYHFPQEGYVADTLRQKFTGKERDDESGLDYFLARYYSSKQGRFLSPDEFAGGPQEFWVLGSEDKEKQALPYADTTNPQSLNKYQYGLHNPLRYIDPDGHQQKESWWESVQRYIASVFRSKVDSNLTFDRERSSEQLSPQLLGLNGDKMVEKHFDAVVKRFDQISDLMELVDQTGAVSLVRNYIKHNSENMVIAVAGMVFGGGKSNVTFGEARKLVGMWGKGTFSKTKDLIKHSFEGHGDQVGAKDVWQFLRKAAGFNEKGAFSKTVDDGVKYWRKDGTFIIKDTAGNIVSYGRNR